MITLPPARVKYMGLQIPADRVCIVHGATLRQPAKVVIADAYMRQCIIVSIEMRLNRHGHTYFTYNDVDRYYTLVDAINHAGLIYWPARGDNEALLRDQQEQRTNRARVPKARSASSAQDGRARRAAAVRNNAARK